MKQSELLTEVKYSKNSDFYNRVVSTVSTTSFLQKMCTIGIIANTFDIIAVCWIIGDNNISDCKYSLRQWFAVYSATSVISLIIQLLGLTRVFKIEESPKYYRIKWVYIINLMFTFYWVIDATLILAGSSKCLKMFRNGYILLYVLSIRYYASMLLLMVLFGFYSFFGTSFKCMETNSE